MRLLSDRESLGIFGVHWKKVEKPRGDCWKIVQHSLRIRWAIAFPGDRCAFVLNRFKHPDDRGDHGDQGQIIEDQGDIFEIAGRSLTDLWDIWPFSGLLAISQQSPFCVKGVLTLGWFFSKIKPTTAIIEFAERSLCDKDRSPRDLLYPREITEKSTEIVERL